MKNIQQVFCRIRLQYIHKTDFSSRVGVREITAPYKK